MDHTDASGQNVKEAESSTANKTSDIPGGPSTSGLNHPSEQNFTTQTIDIPGGPSTSGLNHPTEQNFATLTIDVMSKPSTSGLNHPTALNFATQTIDIVGEPSTSGLNQATGRNLTIRKNIEIVDVPSISGFSHPAGRNFTTQNMFLMDQPYTYGLQAGENYTTYKKIERLDQSSTSGINLQAGDSTSTPRNADICMVLPSKPGLKEKLERCSLSSAQHFITPTMSTTQTGAISKIPVALRKSKKVDRFAETMVSDLYELQPRFCDTIKEIPESMPEMSPDEEEEEYEMQMSKVGDIQIFHQRFTKYYKQMRGLEQSLYDMFGMGVEYERLEQQLTGFLGELCYYREKKE